MRRRKLQQLHEVLPQQARPRKAEGVALTEATRWPNKERFLALAKLGSVMAICLILALAFYRWAIIRTFADVLFNGGNDPQSLLGMLDRHPWPQGVDGSLAVAGAGR